MSKILALRRKFGGATFTVYEHPRNETQYWEVHGAKFIETFANSNMVPSDWHQNTKAKSAEEALQKFLETIKDMMSLRGKTKRGKRFVKTFRKQLESR